MNKELRIPILLICLGAIARLLPHPANFAPLGAIALFSGLYVPKRLSFAIPLAAMLLSDAVIGFYDIRIMAAVYSSFFLSISIGRMLKNKKKPVFICGGVSVGAIIFFLTTNAAVWAFGAMYPHSLSGLMQSYLMAIPFFRNSLLGDLFFTGILVGAAEGLPRLISLYKLRLV